MKAILRFIFIIDSLALILVILVQSGKGGLSGLLGGTGETLFGTRTGTFLTKLTTVLATIFMITALLLAIVIWKG